MSNRAAAQFLFVVAVGFLTQHARADQPEGLKLVVAAVGHKPAPFQAVRLRAEIVNSGPKPITGLLPIENTIRIVASKKIGDDARPGGLIDLLTEVRMRGPNCVGVSHRSTAVTLAPGERRAVTFPVAVRRTDSAVEPLFPTPGKYVLRCQYVYGTRTPPDAPPEGAAGEELSLFTEVIVEVEKAGKRDEAWTAALARDPRLAATLLQPAERCTAARADMLRELIKNASESSYVNYGRLAVARSYLIGDAVPPRNSPRVNRALAADVLEEAISRLEYMGFPFIPHVYLNLAEAAPEHKANSHRVLIQEHRTALEWIDEAGSKMTLAEWIRFRAEPAATGRKP